MNETMKDDTSLLSKIVWYYIDKNDYINKSLKYRTAVYIYMKIPSFDSKACYYVGSITQLASHISPYLNICKTADSPLGVKRDIMFSINLSRSRRGKSKKLGIRINNINNISKVVTSETRLKISSRCNGVSIKVFDKSNNLVNQFPTIKSAAKHFNISDTTVGRYSYKILLIIGLLLNLILINNNYLFI
jgi:NUMOD1 domain